MVENVGFSERALVVNGTIVYIKGSWIPENISYTWREILELFSQGDYVKIRAEDKEKNFMQLKSSMPGEYT